jgi:ubiquinone/menaquinone biosynthesis C-methylase UbiE
MKSFYLVALLFSFLFSANYIGYFRFFREHLLGRLGNARTICDVGCGHGVYLAQMLLHAPRASGRGLDISEASLATTRSLLHHYNVAEDRYELAHADLRGTLPLESSTQDAVTCFEVLEHLDDPFHAIQEIRRIMRPGAALCVSAAVRMESVDHLHVFNHPGEVSALLCNAGFRIVAADAYPLTGTPARGGPAARQAAVDDPRVALGYVAVATVPTEMSA